jgi:hypothetical protein
MFYFTPLPGFFSPFPRGTGSLSVTQEYLAFRGGPRGFTRDFSCPVLLGIQLVSLNFRLQDFHLLWCIIQMLRLVARFHLAVPQPQVKTTGLGSFQFARRYYGKSIFLSLPPATKMFQFAGFARTTLWIQVAVYWVAPFGNLRINARFQLPEAYRR